MAKDPICGMVVPKATALSAQRGGRGDDDANSVGPSASAAALHDPAQPSAAAHVPASHCSSALDLRGYFQAPSTHEAAAAAARRPVVVIVPNKAS